MEFDEVDSDFLEELVGDLTDEVTLGLIFDVHKAAKCGYLFLNPDDLAESEADYKLVDEPGLDVFGQTSVRKQFECECPHCKRHLAASRFAPHLEKCLGMGRSSSRIASKRIANAGNAKNGGSDQESDNDNDKDWTADKKSNKRRRLERSSPRRPRHQRPALTDNGVEGAAYDTMSQPEMRAFLMQACGVISEHTRRMCTRSLRCPQHSEEQRRAVRSRLITDPTLSGELEESQVDVEEPALGPTELLRDPAVMLWEDSPADSSSTNNSTSSRKRHKKKKKKKSLFSKSHITPPLEPLPDFQF